MDHHLSVACNAIGYPSLLISDEPATQKNNSEGETKTSIKIALKSRYQHRQYLHQWICIRDIIDGLITCNHTLKNKVIMDILSKMDLWVKQRNESKIVKSEPSTITTANIKLLKTRARQLVWDLMEMK